MILQALTRYYEALLEKGEISAPGWDDGFPVSFGLNLDEQGQLIQVLPFKTQQLRGKKTVEVPRSMRVPARVKRASGIAANFLCDNAKYLLGVYDKPKDDKDGENKQQRVMDCFAACRTLHERLLSDVDTPAAQAILRFFSTWDPATAAEHPLLAPWWKEIAGSANLIFCYAQTPVTEDPVIARIWQQSYNSPDTDTVCTPCLVTGHIASPAILHPTIKGVRDAQSSGASLVSFNAPAYESFGCEQGANAPVSEYAAFAYGAALNRLLADRQHCRVIGDTTVVCWAEGAAPAYQDFCIDCMFGPSEGTIEQDIIALLHKLSRGECCDWRDFTLNPDEHFYILGLAPNAARLSVRFFLQDSFGAFMQNLDRHYRDIDIVRPAYDHFAVLPIWALIGETVNQKSKNKKPAPQLAGDLLRAVLSGAPYPATLLTGVHIRIKADRSITRGRAAIIKAYYLRLRRRGNMPPNYPSEEELQMELNPESTNIAYTLGRMFSVYEQIQEAANNPSQSKSSEKDKINTTIGDKFLTAASATPATIFPTLGNLSAKHLRKLRRDNTGRAINLEKKLQELSLIIGQAYPTRMTLPEQGSFQLGYYFENQARFTKKEK